MAASWAIVEISFIISSYRKATKHFGLGHEYVVICSVFRASDPEKLWISIPLLGTVNELVDPGTREKCETPCPNYLNSR